MSGDNVRGKPVFDDGDYIFEAELAFLQPLQGQLIPNATVPQCPDRIIQIAMLAPENFKFHTQYLVGLHGKVCGGIHLFDDSILFAISLQYRVLGVIRIALAQKVLLSHIVCMVAETGAGQDCRLR